ncbi:hypothetical protein B0H10DRAFT_2129359 [Mycena sp. CBHHK59/15]|nr:hypothetical protein B0H10DRAFT_2129359 [Mycena sp. CBHHK59/15]
MPKADTTTGTNCMGLHLIPLIERAATENLTDVEQDKIQKWIENRNPDKLNVKRLEAIYQKIVNNIRLTQADVAFFTSGAPCTHLSSRPPPISPSTPKTGTHLLSMNPAIDDDAGQTEPFLGSLGSFAGTTGDLFTVVPKAIMFIDSEQKKTPRYSRIPFKPFGTLSGLIFCKPQCAFTIALAVWPANPVGRSVAEWANDPMHCNVMVLIHAPKIPGLCGPGKVLLICEPNITEVEERERKADKILSSHMVEFINAIHPRFTEVWVNHERRERNETGICLCLVLEWMVEMVAAGKDGLNIKRNDEHKITGIKGFRRIEM